MKDMTSEVWSKHLDINADLPIEHTYNSLKSSIDIHLQRVLASGCNDILDIGAGDGYASSVLKNNGKNVIATSVNIKEVEHMCSLGIDARHDDMHNMGFEDNTFDCVYMRQVLEHAIAPYMVFSEIYRVLKHEGCLILILPPEIDITNTNGGFVYTHNYPEKHYCVLTDVQLYALWQKFDFTLMDIWSLITVNGQDRGYKLQCNKIVEGSLGVRNGQIDDGQMRG